MQSLASQNPEQFDLYFKINDLGSDCPSNIDVFIIAYIASDSKIENSVYTKNMNTCIYLFSTCDITSFDTY